MQIYPEPGRLNSAPLVLGVPRGARERQKTVRRAPAVTPCAALRQAQREALQSHSAEQLVWGGLALAALGVLVLSLWV